VQRLRKKATGAIKRAALRFGKHGAPVRGRE
jgi:hypothetical protein